MGYTRGGVLPAGLTIFGRRQWSEAALLNQGRRKEATPHVKLARSLRPRTSTEGEHLD